MRYILCIICLIVTMFGSAKADVVFVNKHQSWDFKGVENTPNYTALLFDIKILSNKAGCFDAHSYDVGNASIYIEGDFGRHKIYKSEFEGIYEPWVQSVGAVNWNYYEKGNKGLVAHAKFVFARIPIGISNMRFHFYGGWADESAESDKYECPRFDLDEISIPNNENFIRQTGWTESSLREEWSKNEPTSSIEGIYTFANTSDDKWWGQVHHRLAIKKEGNNYSIIYLGGGNGKIWTEGELKGDFSTTATAGLYKVNSWRIENKILSGADFYIKYSKRYLSLFDNRSKAETIFLKLYPEEDIDKVGEQNTPTDKEGTSHEILGNGSGVFVGGNIIASAFHVVEKAKNIEVVIYNGSKVARHKASILCSDKQNDLVLLTISDKDFVPLQSLPFSLLSKTSDTGAYIYTLGYPMADVMGNSVKLTDGIISSKTGYQGDIVRYQISAPIQPGSSGCPVFDKNGNLLGIASSGIPGAENVGYAIKTSYLRNLIEAAPVDVNDIFSPVSKVKGKDLSEQVKILQNYVVLIYITN